MFFLSKLGWLMIQPFSLVFFLVVASLCAGRFGRRRLQTAAGLLAALFLFVPLYTTAGPVLLAVLENRFSRPALPAPPACILVLGGGFHNEVTTARGGVELNDAGDRYVEMLRLARIYPEARLLVSGGDGSLTGHREDDVAVARRLMADFGLDQSRLIAEPVSRNTYENALNSRRIMAREGLSRCLLVTSAFHMPRAVGMMRQVGADVLPWPVDYRTDGSLVFGLSLTEPAGNADNLLVALREWVGLIANRIAGRTTALFPGPQG